MKAAIWIDKRNAWIMKLDGQKEEFDQVESAVEEMKPMGGFRGKTPDQSQGGTPDNKVLNRQTNQFKDFFDKVIAKVDSSESIVIEGPADTKTELVKRLREQKRLDAIEVDVKNADSMTMNQFKAEARQLLS